MAERLRILGSIRRRGAGRLASRLAGLENQNQAIAANAPSGANSLGALVIGGGIRGLSIAGSLGHRGIPVWVMTTGNDRLATLSRYTRRTLPWITGSPEEQVEYLLRLAREHHLDGWALFPTADEPAAFLSRFRRELATRFRVTTPDWDVLRWAYDKRLTYQLAAQESVDHPWTLCPASEADLEAVDGRFPVILKPAVKANANRFTADKAWPAESRDRLLARYREARTVGPPELILVQEMIPGGGGTRNRGTGALHAGRHRLHGSRRTGVQVRSSRPQIQTPRLQSSNLDVVVVVSPCRGRLSLSALAHDAGRPPDGDPWACGSSLGANDRRGAGGIPRNLARPPACR